MCSLDKKKPHTNHRETMTLLIFYVLLALGVSFMCSVLEAVLLSVTPSYVAVVEKDNAKLGKQLRAYKDDIDRPLAAILSLNTIAHTIGAAGAGAQAAIVFKDTSIAVFSAVLTLLILVLSEIIPKTLGALYWRQMVPMVVRLLHVLILILWPLVKLSQWLTKWLSAGHTQEALSREEFHALTEIGEEAGVFEGNESKLLRSILRFSSLRVKDIMTPRIVLFALQQDRTVQDIMDQHPHIKFSRIPVFEERVDDTQGYILKDDLLTKAAQDEHETTLEALKRPFMMVPETLSLPDVFDQLIEKSEYIAIVVDEFGGVSGLVTVEDVVETILDLEIVDEADANADMQALARKQWEKRAKRLGLVLPGEEDKEEDKQSTSSDDTVEDKKTT